MKNVLIISAIFGFILIIGAYAQSSNVNSATKKFIYAEYVWEYRGDNDNQKGGYINSLHISDALEKEIDELKYPMYAMDLLGSEGWELVSTTELADDFKNIKTHYFKKEVK